MRYFFYVALRTLENIAAVFVLVASSALSDAAVKIDSFYHREEAGIAARLKKEEAEVSQDYKAREDYDSEDTTSRQRYQSKSYALLANRMSSFMPTEWMETTAINTAIQIEKPKERKDKSESYISQTEQETDPLPHSEVMRVCDELKTEAVFRSGRQTHPETKERLVHWLLTNPHSVVYLKLAESIGLRSRDYSITAASLN